MENEIRMTKLASCAGCGAKVGAGTLAKLHVLAVEMEGAALYLNAAKAGKKALVLCTISDNPTTGEGLSSEERQTSFHQMMEIALEVAEP